ncbi:T9SS type A sorting domain-containing protein, partial [Odoribacter sp. OttesenSCG-928-L07]|nr:T9SS type A sorting domain-containing protein [Odoribacter sp. OttesenSCG-928-L07]
LNTTNYEINLSQLSGIECYDNTHFNLETNLPGKARLSINTAEYGDIRLQIFDISGKAITKEQLINNVNNIDIHIGRQGIYFLRLITAKELFSYKLTGEQSDGNISISTNNILTQDLLKTEPDLLTLNYKEGDTVRLTVYSTDFHGNLVEKIPVNGDQYTTYLSKPCECGTVTDYEGNVYETVQIGSQCWMRENLRSWKYANGVATEDPPTVMPSCKESAHAPGAEENGLAYQASAALLRTVVSDTLPDIIQGICPNGWHLPSDEEWMELERYLGMSEDEIVSLNFRGTNEATMLKEPGTLHWYNYDDNALSTNETGFWILGCTRLENYKEVWFVTSTVDHYGGNHNYPYIYYRKVHEESDKIFRGVLFTWSTLCVRCIKNDF